MNFAISPSTLCDCCGNIKIPGLTVYGYCSKDCFEEADLTLRKRARARNALWEQDQAEVTRQRRLRAKREAKAGQESLTELFNHLMWEQALHRAPAPTPASSPAVAPVIAPASTQSPGSQTLQPTILRPWLRPNTTLQTAQQVITTANTLESISKLAELVTGIASLTPSVAYMIAPTRDALAKLTVTGNLFNLTRRANNLT